MRQNDFEFVDGKLDSVAPRWRPDAGRAWQRLAVEFDGPLADFGGRRVERGRRVTARARGAWNSIGVAATVGVCIATALLFPETRAIAQGLWDRLVLNRVDVLRLDLSKLPLRTHVTMGVVEEPVANIGEAERKAGFRPDLPAAAILEALPELTVTGVATVEQEVNVHDLESALTRAGANGILVPPAWDGVTLRAEIGPTVTAKYPDGIVIVQVPPVEVQVPAGFPLDRLVEALFRSIGVSPNEALSLEHEFAAHPSLMFDVPPGLAANVEEVRLRSGPATMIENLNVAGAVELVSAIRLTGGRTYVVSSRTRELTMKIAESLP